MVVDKSISMNVNETLELDYLIEQVSNDKITIDDEPKNVSATIEYIKKESGVFNPPDTGTYQLGINDQTVEITVSDIPDSAINRYEYGNFSTSSWTDSIGSIDLSSITGLTGDGTAFGGYGGVSGDGTDDYAQDTEFTYMENNTWANWAISFGISTTADGGIFGFYENGGSANHYFRIETGGLFTSGRVGVARRANSNPTDKIESDVGIADGEDYVVLIQSTGDAVEDLSMYFEPTTEQSSVTSTGSTPGTGETVSWEEPTYFAIDNGSIGNNLSAQMTDIIWYNDAFTTEEGRQEVFDLYPWYDPSTDAP